MTVMTLKNAEQISPKTVRNRIVRTISQQGEMERGARISDVLPMVELSNATEVYFRQNGTRRPMPNASFTGESPITELEPLSEDDVDVSAYKEKVCPEKGANTELNSEVEILRLFNYASDSLATDAMLSREVAGWRGDSQNEGLVGEDGNDAHSELPTDHVITGSDYSNTGSASPQDDFITATTRIDIDGSNLNEAGTVTAYVPPSVMGDLKKNDNLESRFQGVEPQALTEDQVANILPVDNLEPVYTRVPRTNDSGEPIDDSDNVVSDRDDAVEDNVLEPYDFGSGTQRRNVVIAAPGETSGFMPWFLDRLAERADAAPETSDVSLDSGEGIMTQIWTDNDPLVTWFKIAQEFGVEIQRGENFAVLQDV